MKIPTMGQIVLFHFNLGYQGPLITRPACVITAKDTGHCGLTVFYGGLEYLSNHVVEDVIGHREGSGELGKIEREEPQARTWSWPPRVT